MKKYDQLLVKISGGDDDKASIISKINDNVPKPEETVPIMAQQYLDPDIQEPFQPGSTPVHLESRLGNFFLSNYNILVFHVFFFKISFFGKGNKKICEILQEYKSISRNFSDFYLYQLYAMLFQQVCLHDLHFVGSCCGTLLESFEVLLLKMRIP